MTSERVADESFSRIRWEDPRRGPWGIQAMWVNINGRPECVGLTLWRGADQGNESHLSYSPIPGQKLRPITATAVAELPVATIIDQLRDAARTHWAANTEVLRAHLSARGIDPDDDPNWLAIVAPSSFEEAAPRSPGAPARYDLEHFVKVSELYLEAWHAGRKPTQAVADAFDVSRSTAAKWVTRARGDGMQLLTPAEHGRPGAKPGPALKRIRRAKGSR